METLELLRDTEALLSSDRPFSFSNWTTCTCGFIYEAAMGERAEDENQVRAERDGRPIVFLEAIKSVAVALGWVDPYQDPAGFVSDYTFYARSDERPIRQDALAVVRDAIAAVEAQYEAARLDVLAQTREILDNAAEPMLALS